jgi:hypothetical protein
MQNEELIVTFFFWGHSPSLFENTAVNIEVNVDDESKCEYLNTGSMSGEVRRAQEF